MKQIDVISISDDDIQRVFNTSILSFDVLQKQIIYCQFSLNAARLTIAKANILLTLLKDLDFQDYVLDLVSAVCSSFSIFISDKKFIDLILECFIVDQRQEYAQLLPNQIILQYVTGDQIEFFSIIVEKMIDFDQQVIQVMKQFISYPASVENLICLRSLFAKFPEEMNNHEVFELVLKNFQYGQQNQQNELSGIVQILIYRQLITIDQINSLIDIFEQKVYLFDCQLELIELFLQFVQIPPSLVQIIQNQSNRVCKTQKYCLKLLKYLM